MAAVLLGLARGEGPADNGHPVVGVRLPQERLAEMLGVSRPWAALLVREMSAAGLVDWQYGRATLLDPAGLRGIARGGINAALQCRSRPDAPSSATGQDSCRQPVQTTWPLAASRYRHFLSGLQAPSRCRGCAAGAAKLRSSSAISSTPTVS
jgi:hypothetical protein